MRSAAQIASPEWLFELEADSPPQVDGLVIVDTYTPNGRPPDEVAIIDKARAYGVHSVLFEAARNGRPPVPQAFVFVASGRQQDFAKLHQRLWSWGGVPMLFRISPGEVGLFRCAHQPDFAVSGQEAPAYRPFRLLALGARISDEIAWWDAKRLRNGTFWDDPNACELLLSANKSAHRKLLEEISILHARLSENKLLEPGLRKRLVILSLLIAYLEERGVLVEQDFAQHKAGAVHFFDVLKSGPALLALLDALEERFNGNVFSLSTDERHALEATKQLPEYARLVQGFQDSTGQQSFWKLYSFRDLPVELISNIYQLFVTSSGSVYTPPALVRMMLEEALDWDRLDALMSGDQVILDPACGSGVFLVEAYKRLVIHWRSRNDWARPGVEQLRPLLERVHGLDLEEGAVQLAAFSLCLALCDALEPDEIRSGVKLFPALAGRTLHHSCFFSAKLTGLSAPVGIIVGNPPFTSALPTEGARRAAIEFAKDNGALPDKQLAYLFLNDAMQALAPGGLVAMIQPAGLLYNQKTLPFRRALFQRWDVREILDLVSVRGMFKKGDADPKVVVVIAEANPPSEQMLLHAVFRRNGRAEAEQGFDIDYYDLHWLEKPDAASPDVWRSNLLGGGRVRSFIERLRGFRTMGDYARERLWKWGEGFIEGTASGPAPEHLVGKPYLDSRGLTADGIDTNYISKVPDIPVQWPRNARQFTPPLLLFDKHESLNSAVWVEHYLTYRAQLLGLAAPVEDLPELTALHQWLTAQRVPLQAYLTGTSSALFTQRATAILSADILRLPYPGTNHLDISSNERIVAEDVVNYQRDLVRRGADARVMRRVSPKELQCFHEVFMAQVNTVYSRTPLRALPSYSWPGAICCAYSFGEGSVDWSDAQELQGRLDSILHERARSSLTVTRIARLYDDCFLFLLKPDALRFWLRSVALRDGDDVLADLREQGF